jgi:hypothetical protein
MAQSRLIDAETRHEIQTHNRRQAGSVSYCLRPAIRNIIGEPMRILITLLITAAAASAQDALQTRVVEYLTAMIRQDTSNPPGNETRTATFLKPHSRQTRHPRRTSRPRSEPPQFHSASQRQRYKPPSFTNRSQRRSPRGPRPMDRRPLRRAQQKRRPLRPWRSRRQIAPGRRTGGNGRNQKAKHQAEPRHHPTL